MSAPKPDATITELHDFIHTTLDSVLQYKATECTELMPTTLFNSVWSFTKMFDAIANSNAASVVPQASRYATAQAGDNYLPQLRLVAMFCLI